MDQGKPATVKPFSTPALEGGEQTRPYRFWWLAIIVLSLAGWGLILAAISLLVSLVR